MAVLKQPLSNPESGWNRYDDNDSRISYVNGTWSNAGGGTQDYNTTTTTTSTVNAEVRFNITGNKLRIICQTWTNFSNNVEVWVDGKLIDSFTTAFAINSTNGYRVLVFEKLDLSEGEHFVKLISKQAFTFRLDALDIDSNATLKPYKEPSNKILLSSGDKYRSVKKGVLVDSNVIPVHSSNTSQNGGLVNTNNTVPSTAYTLFDGNSSNNLTFSLMTNVWVSYEFPSPKTITKYTLIVTGASSINRAPRVWKFEGSNDGTIWIELDYQNESSNNWTMGVKRSFAITNTIKFKFYRVFIFLSNNGSSIAPSLSEIEMMEMSSNELYELDTLNENTALNYGSDTSINLTEIFTKAKVIKSTNSTVGSGKTFEHTVDMSKRRVDKITLG